MEWTVCVLVSIAASFVSSGCSCGGENDVSSRRSTGCGEGNVVGNLPGFGSCASAPDVFGVDCCCGGGGGTYTTSSLCSFPPLGVTLPTSGSEYPDGDCPAPMASKSGMSSETQKIMQQRQHNIMPAIKRIGNMIHIAAYTSGF